MDILFFFILYLDDLPDHLSLKHVSNIVTNQQNLDKLMSQRKIFS